LAPTAGGLAVELRVVELEAESDAFEPQLQLRRRC